MRKLLFGLTLLVGLLWVSDAGALDGEGIAGAYRKGLILAQRGADEAGAEHWARQALVVKGIEEASLHRGLFLILAAMTYERIGSPEAYSAWTDALGVHFEAGTTWTLQRDAWLERMDEARLAGSAGFALETAIPPQGLEVARLLVSLNDLLAFTRYDGPEPGLTRADDPLTSSVTVSARSYFPRPRREDQALDAQQGEPAPASALVTGRGLPVGPPLSDQPAGRSSQVSQPGAAAIALPTLRLDLRRASGHPLAAILARIVGTVTEGSSTPVRRPVARPVPASDHGTVGKEPFADIDLAHPVMIRERQTGRLELSAGEQAAARSAWSYFAANTQADTGLFNSVHNYTYMTMWDMGSGLAALFGAHQTDVLATADFESRMARYLGTMAVLPLYDNVLPNREYNTRTGEMTDLRNRPSEVGSGYSALDIGRVLTWLAIIERTYPRFVGPVRRVVARWDLSRMVSGGEFFRETLTRASLDRAQEGRLGYEQYAALGAGLWGLELPDALDLEETTPVDLEGRSILRDTRDPDFLNAEPYYLLMLEHDAVPERLVEEARVIFDVHRRRSRRTGSLSIFTEDAADVAPWFLYNIISQGEESWLCLTFSHVRAERCQSLSTKGAFAFDAVFDMPFSRLARTAVIDNVAPAGGYYAGYYETGTPNRSRNANTNAVILEALAYKVRGFRPFLADNPVFTPIADNRS